MRYRQGHGATPPGPARRVPFAERFARFVDLGGPDECWLWTGTGADYGHTKIDGTTVGAHVATYELFHGPVPDGLVVRHSCDTPRCCNPAHLLVGTYADNSHDAVERNRVAWGERCSGAVLTAGQVHEIREMRSAGKRVCDITRSLNVGRGAVRGVIEGKTWVRL